MLEKCFQVQTLVQAGVKMENQVLLALAENYAVGGEGLMRRSSSSVKFGSDSVCKLCRQNLTGPRSRWHISLA